MSLGPSLDDLDKRIISENYAFPAKAHTDRSQSAWESTRPR